MDRIPKHHAPRLRRLEQSSPSFEGGRESAKRAVDDVAFFGSAQQADELDTAVSRLHSAVASSEPGPIQMKAHGGTANTDDAASIGRSGLRGGGASLPYSNRIQALSDVTT